MLYSIRFTVTAFDLLPSFHPDFKKQLKTALKELKVNPALGKRLKQDLAGYQSYRLKRYRIIYQTIKESETVQVHYVGHRNNVYELFAQLVSQH